MSIIDSIRLSGTTYQIQVTVDAALDSGSTNPVANSAITTALDDKVNVVDNEVPDYNVTSEITYQGGYPSQSETASTWDSASMFTLRYNYISISDVNYTTTAAVIDPSNNITTGRVTVEESVGNPLPDYIDMSFSNDAYRFTAKEGYRIAHLDIYNDKWATWGYIREEKLETVFEGGQSADVIKDVIEPTLINKQDQLVSGTNIKTINNTSILGSGNIDIQGGGKAIEAGRGIAITTGETADTVSFNLPISGGTGANSIIEGNDTTASGRYSHAEGNSTRANGTNSHAEGSNTTATSEDSHSEGHHTKASGVYGSHAEGRYTIASGVASHAEGYYTEAKNNAEHASGWYNVSSSASTTFGDSGNTLFSVGNGTSTSARHNAFEIRQNGDIYLTKDGQDVKLQDHLGGSSITVDTALDSGSTNPVQNKVIYAKIDEVEEVTAAGLNALNDKITPTVELTQAEYDALVDKDPNTYYIITDAQAGDLTNYYTKSETNTLLGGKADTATTYTKTEVDTALGGKQATLVSGTNIKTINNESILGSGNIDIQGGSDINVVQTTGTSTTDVMSQNAVTTQLSGYVTTDTEQTISGRKIFTYSSSSNKAIEFKQTSDSAKVGFRVINSAATNNEVASFEFRPNTFIINGVQHPLLYFGHYRTTATANAGVPQTVIGFRQYDQKNIAAYHYLMPLPEKAKTPFGLTTTFKDYYAPMGFKNGSTMIKADDTGVVDLSSELGGLKLKKLTQAEYDALATKDSNTLYVIVN